MEKQKLDTLVNFRCKKAEREAWLAATKHHGGLSKVIRAHLDSLVAREEKKASDA